MANVNCTDIARLHECALLVVANADLLRQWVNGDEQTDVTLGGKLTPSIRKLVAEIDARESAAAQKVIDAGIIRIEEITAEHTENLKAEGEIIITRAANEADRAFEEANRAALVADMGVMESGVYNIRKPFVVHEAIPAGSLLTLPGWYYPTRDVLQLSYDGVVCVPRKIGVEPYGKYQYEEIGTDPNAVSNEVRVHFDVPAGAVLDMWVVSSAAGRNIEELTAAAEQAREEADRAERAADMAEVCAGCSGAEVWWVLEEDVPAGTPLTFPAGFFYLYNQHHLHCTNGGVFVSPERYQETGTVPGEKCTSIVLEYDLKAGEEFHAWVTPLGAGSGEDTALQVAELAALVARQQAMIDAQQKAIENLQQIVDELRDYHVQSVYALDASGQPTQIYTVNDAGEVQEVYAISRTDES